MTKTTDIGFVVYNFSVWILILGEKHLLWRHYDLEFIFKGTVTKNICSLTNGPNGCIDLLNNNDLQNRIAKRKLDKVLR